MTDPNQGAGDGSQGATAGKPLSVEDVERITANVMNQTITARFKTFQKQLSEQLTESFGASMKKQFEDFAAAQPNKGGKGGKGKEGEGAGDAGDGDQSPAVRSMKRQLEELTSELGKQKAAADAATQRERAGTLRQRASEALGSIGITEPARIKGALATLFAEGRIAYDEDDPESIVFKDSDGSPLDLPTGVKAWAKSEDAKIFLPPSGARGSGDRPGQGLLSKQTNSGELSPTDLGLAIAREFGGVPIG